MVFCLHFFHGVIEKVVDKNRIQTSFRVLALNLPFKELDAPYAAAAQLYLPWMTIWYQFQSSDMGLQWWAVLEASERVEHLRYAVVWA